MTVSYREHDAALTSAAAAIIKGSNETVTYNGAAQAYSQGTIDKGTLVVTYYTSEDNRTNGTNGTTDAPTDANTYYVLLTQGNTNYTADPKNATFTINPKTLTDDMVTLSPESFEYNGAIQKPEVTVADGTALTGDDYTIENNGGKDVDTYNVVVTAKRNYIGKVTKTFKITNRKLKATDVTFNAHWASYYNSTEDVDLPEGIAAYVVTSVGETTATATQISYIPAGVPVLLQDEVTTTTTNTSADGNMMAHATDDVTVASLGGTIYGLYNGKLMRVASGTIPAGKNYIKVSQPNAARQLSIVIGEGGATAIMTLEMDEENDTDEWYTLDGRKLQRKPVKNGLYLQNGKKVVINNK